MTGSDVCSSDLVRDLLDANKRHGHFLELVLLLSKCDAVLCTHVYQCAEEAKNNKVN